MPPTTALLLGATVLLPLLVVPCHTTASAHSVTPAAAAPPPPPPHSANDHTFLAGVQFLAQGFEGEYAYDTPEAAASLAQAAQTGATSVTLSFPHYIRNVSEVGAIYPIPGGCPSGAVFNNASSPTDAELLAALALARRLNLTVALRPMVDPDFRFNNASITFRGHIGTGFSRSQWQLWFAEHFGPFVLKYAHMAAAQGVAALSVGAELNTVFRQQPDLMRQLIAQVRRVYPGQLHMSVGGGVAALEQIGFWDAVDVVGSDAYFPLTTNISATEPNPSVGALVRAWQPVIAQLTAFKQAHPTFPKILFTEFGGVSAPFMYQHPARFAGADSSPPCLACQANFYEAFFQAVWCRRAQLDWFAGVQFWKWDTTPAPHGGSANNSDFFPQQKPAQDVMAKYFRQCPGPPRAAGS